MTSKQQPSDAGDNLAHEPRRNGPDKGRDGAGTQPEKREQANV